MKTIEKVLFRRAQEQYRRLLEEGHDVVLPPEPLIPVSASFARQAGNYPINRAGVKLYVGRVVAKFGIRQKVFVIVLDTGASSQNRYIQRNFLNLGLDHTGENQPVDEHGHFSFCSSQIVGTYNGNPLGALRYPGLPLDFWAYCGEKVLGKNGSGSYIGIQNGLEHALEIADKKKAEGYRVIFSCSWGGGGSHNGIRQVFEQIRARGHFTFAAAGNSGDSGVNFPASIPHDELGEVLFAIGAVGQDDKLAGFSSRGEQVDFCSYGVNNTGAGPGENAIRIGSGTSYAAPFAAGCAGLLLATFPEIENMADLEYVLKNGITDLGPEGRDKDYGHGLIRMSHYGDDDLPGDNPDDPGDEPDGPGQPTPLPERPLRIALSGEFRMAWGLLERQLEDMATSDEGGAVSVDARHPAAASQERSELSFREVIVHLRSRQPAEVAAKELQAFAEKHWASRGVLMTPPGDFELAGAVGLYFFRMFAQRAGLQVEQASAIARNESGYPAEAIVVPPNR